MPANPLTCIWKVLPDGLTLPWTTGAVVAPLTENDTVDGDGLRVGCSAGRATDGDALAGQESAGVEEEFGEGVVPAVEEEVLLAERLTCAI